MTKPYHGATHPGMVRQNNEDAFFVQPVLQQTLLAACVIDGVGGYEGGEVAAAIAREVLLQYLAIPSGTVPQMMTEAMLAANDQIIAARNQQARLSDMACVATLALVDEAGNQLYYTHVGDTRLYLFRDGSLVKLTRDQSFVGFLEDNGKLTEEEAMRHLKRNEIDKALGFDPQARQTPNFLDSGTSPFLPGDVLLLCSDGLTDLVNAESITAVLKAPTSLQHKTEALIAAANTAGGKDNITVVLVQHSRKPKMVKAVAPKKKAAPKKSTENRKKRKNIAAPASEITPQPSKETKRNRKWWLVPLLVVVPIVTGLAIWWVQTRHETAQEQVRDNKQRFLELLQTAADTLVWNDTLPILIKATDTLFVAQDSLVIMGNGLQLRADSTLPGDGLVLLPANKFLALNNVVFEGFATGIVADSQVLHLRQVRFRKVGVPVSQYAAVPVNSPDQLYIEDSLFTRSDTLKRR